MKNLRYIGPAPLAVSGYGIVWPNSTVTIDENAPEVAAASAYFLTPDSFELATDYGAVADWNGTGGTDNTIALQRALNSGADLITLPKGTVWVSGNLVVPSGVAIEGAADGSTVIYHTGTGFLFTSSNLVNFSTMRKPPSFRRFRVTGSANGLGGIQISNYFRAIVENVTVEGYTAGTGLKLYNQGTGNNINWTEGFRAEDVYFRNNSVGVHFAIEYPADTAARSFAETSLRDVSIVMLGLTQVGILLDQNAIVYGSRWNIKANIETAANVVLGTGPTIFKLLSGALLYRSDMFYHVETFSGYAYVRFNLAANAKVSGTGWGLASAPTGAGGNPYDIIEATAYLSEDANRRLTCGNYSTPGEMQIGAPYHASVAQTNNGAKTLAALPDGICSFTVKYAGTGNKNHQVRLVATTPRFNSNPNLVLVSESIYSGNSIFSGFGIDYDANGVPYLTTTIANAAVDGVLSITGVIESGWVTTAPGNSPFPAGRPLYLLPDTSAVSLTASVGVSLAAGNLGVRIGNSGTRVSRWKHGTATLSGGSVVVSDTSVTANTRILPGHHTISGTAGFLHAATRTAGTSFTITSSNAGDNSVVAYTMIEP